MAPPAARAGPYQAVRRADLPARRAALLTVAGQVLEQDGAQTLSMRVVAQLAGCSTMVLYSLFGDRRGLLEALYLQGFAWLGAGVARVQPDRHDSSSVLLGLFDAYRAFALAHPTYYSLMFERGTTGFQPSEAARAQGWLAIAPLVQAAGHCLQAGLLHAENPEAAALSLWASAHGVVSLELAGNLPAEQARTIYAQLIAGQLRPSR